MNSDRVVEDYLDAVVLAIEGGGATKFWPFAPGQTDSYFIDLLSTNLFEKFKKDPGKFKEALFLPPPNVLRWFLLPFVVLGLKLARNYEGYRVTSEETINFIKVVWEVLGEKVRSDPFCLDGKNMVLSQQEVESVKTQQHWFEGINRRPVAMLGVDLESFVWSINFDLYAYGVYWGGPYLLPGKTLITKNFIDLDIPVWNISRPYRNIEIYYIFNGKVKTAIDFMSHMVYEDDIWDKLMDFAIVVDGKMVQSVAEIEKLSEYFSQERDMQMKLINNLSPKQLIQKSAEIYHYMFHDLFTYFGEDWQPPKVFKQRLDKEGLKHWNQFKPGLQVKQPDSQFFRKLYDPRNSFTD